LRLVQELSRWGKIEVMAVLPKFITKYFWGDDLTELSMAKHKRYIANTILEKGNTKAVKWLTGKVPKKELKKNLSKKMSPKSRNFWQLYF